MDLNRGKLPVKTEPGEIVDIPPTSTSSEEIKIKVDPELFSSHNNHNMNISQSNPSGGDKKSRRKQQHQLLDDSSYDFIQIGKSQQQMVEERKLYLPPPRPQHNNNDNNTASTTTTSGLMYSKRGKRSKIKLDELALARRNRIRCSLCPKSFSTLNFKTRHMAQAHGVVTILTCFICSTHCSDDEALLVHLKSHAGDSPPYVCTIPGCFRPFDQLFKWLNHVRLCKEQNIKTESNPSTIWVFCPVVGCPEKFSSYYKRKQHLLNFHGDAADDNNVNNDNFTNQYKNKNNNNNIIIIKTEPNSTNNENNDVKYKNNNNNNNNYQKSSATPIETVVKVEESEKIEEYEEYEENEKIVEIGHRKSRGRPKIVKIEKLEKIDGHKSRGRPKIVKIEKIEKIGGHKTRGRPKIVKEEKIEKIGGHKSRGRPKIVKIEKLEKIDRPKSRGRPKIVKIKKEEKIEKIDRRKIKGRPHRRTYNKIFWCLVKNCNQYFDRKTALAAHKRTHLSETRDTFKCSSCPKFFLTLWTLNAHKKKAHGQIPQTSESDDPQSPTTSSSTSDKTSTKILFKCSAEDCELSFESHYKLMRHVKLEHLDKKEYACLLCPASFSQGSQLRNHVKFIHDDAPKTSMNNSGLNACPIPECAGVFQSSEYLNNHVKYQHESKVPRCFICFVCQYGTTTQERLDKHMEFKHRKFTTKQEKREGEVGETGFEQVEYNFECEEEFENEDEEIEEMAD